MGSHVLNQWRSAGTLHTEARHSQEKHHGKIHLHIEIEKACKVLVCVSLHKIADISLHRTVGKRFLTPIQVCVEQM